MSVSQHPHGTARSIISFNGSNLEFDEDSLRGLLLHPQVKDREIAVISIVGAYRKGKSFFMDYCLRFMYANFKSINNPANPLSSPSAWLGDQDLPLTGFSWRSGSKRDTTGLSFWSDVFLHDSNSPLAILLVDTQGLFDPETSTEENAKILTLTTLLSSTMILNINNVIQEDQLQYLQYATEFATFALSRQSSKPFQKLMFLIRDWQNVEDFELGIEGGRGYLEQVLRSTDSQSDELRLVREHLRDTFEELLCCLMPYPGKKVATSSDYDGRWSAMDEDFLSELQSLIESTLRPENVNAKKVNGVTVTGSGFFDIIKDYVTALSTPGRTPKAKTLFELTVGRYLTNLVQKCFEIYESNLKLSPETTSEIDAILRNAEQTAMAAFDSTKKMGGAEDEQKFKSQLRERIQARELEWGIQARGRLRAITAERIKAAAAQREAQRIAFEREREEIGKKVDHIVKLVEIEYEREQARKRHEQEIKELEEKIERERARQRELQWN